MSSSNNVEKGMMLHSSISNSIHNSNHNSDAASGKGRDGSMGGNNNSAAASAAAAAAAANAMSSFKLILLVFMVLQNSSTVLVGRYTRSTSGTIQESDLYVVNHFLVVTETTKLLLAALLESWTTSGNLFKSLHQHCFQNPMDALKIMVPALLYLVQNTLLYVALGNLTAPIFQVTYQAKLVTTALVSVVMLQRAYSIQQWICLLGLSLGVATVVLGERGSSVMDTNSGNLVVGLIAVSISCLSSALAGVYFEMVLKKNTPAVKSVDGSPSSSATVPLPPPSLWMRNIQLAFFSVLIAVGQGMWKNVQNGGTYFSANLSPDNKPYLFGFTVWVWILVALQAGGGLLVAAVIKYADNVLKGLATGVSVVLSSALAMLFFATPLGKLFCVGATVILMSVYYFSNPSPQFVQQVCTQHLHINLNAVFGYKQKTGSCCEKNDSESPSSSGVGGGGGGDGNGTSSPSSSGSELTKSFLPK